ncbi:TetR/AcrR family transcriptional regulator [Nocardia farcinica]|uniref:TetR/AcrR family transcriptional regulator n=1 Tax=Nocardia farcinica TaxID=37329 RepID=UPI001894BA67|nr:TetR/AcrR family transcriptional regulator [Nocardia farcinica]MBF6284017.1 TetR/AcrR family transcriptional regulator [Nocardia farcinica]MBF6308640.1 TetR/AcrR family transcriptional regulator [Nocardia farcinica]MBF6393150.1 TetR/AcrR family transcriptional regulator [Nocardia farcinica]MBF6493310.1 TetR/AcrR family transcriptional regulator [Nocardia farcinica]MBF6511135.1 TetR/AcrR family transcriptional regulator [Nocardia farcinica]
MGDASLPRETPVSTTGPAPAQRRRRADAERNRRALLDAARAALADGTGSFSLEAVARQAGVGIGTLYRHFPTREQLVTAAYDAQVEDLLAQAGALVDKLPPRQALREWMNHFAQLVTAKHGMLDALHTSLLDAAHTPDVAGIRARMAAAITPILQAGADDGSLRADVQAADVVLLIAGSLMPVRDDAARTQRLLTLVLDALRPMKAG